MAIQTLATLQISTNEAVFIIQYRDIYGINTALLGLIWSSNGREQT